MFPLTFLEKVRVEIKKQQESTKISPAAQVFPLYETARRPEFSIRSPIFALRVWYCF